MSLFINCQSLSKSYASRTLFEGLDLILEEGDNLALVGPNGSGKSTLLKMLAGKEKADSGVLSIKKGLKIGYVAQSTDFPEVLPKKILIDAIDQDMPLYEKERLAEMWLSKMGFSEEKILAKNLSGGWKKRLSFALELILSPDLLLLDEPTNHLDLEGILWLEKFLKREAPTFLVVSHDRYFLQNTANKVVEIDRIYPKGAFAVNGDYLTFLKRKGEFLEAQINQEKSIASKVRRESDWLKAGVKARTTKSQARIDEAHEIIQEHKEIRSRNQKRISKIQFVSSERETRKLVVAKNLSKSLGGKTLFQNLDFTLSPGSRIGLLGLNGTGKTTLLKMIYGSVSPDVGTIKRAEDLQMVYFDQHRLQLADDLTLKEALSPQGDYVNFRGQEVHVNGWCKRFLFSPDLLEMKVGNLSGGERARISIAHLMLKPADILLLDEPTNDLDIATLEVLEESLIDFPGAVVLITHDRCMMDRICSSLFSLGDSETVSIYSDFSQWEETKKQKKESKEVVKSVEKRSTQKKLSYLEKKEFGSIEGKIDSLEKEVKLLNEELLNPELANHMEKLTEICKEIAAKENQIERLYLRWEELS